MKKVLMIMWLLGATSLPVSAMNMFDDPRAILSFRDKALLPELDILRVMVTLSPDDDLIFQVKTKGERQQSANQDYLLLQILHEKNYVLLVSLDKERGNEVLVYESGLPSEEISRLTVNQQFQLSSLSAQFSAKHVSQGMEFSVPLEWINFGADFGYDAYTVQAHLQDNHLQIIRIYDQARKGQLEAKRFSAITLLNRICSPQRR